MKKIYLLLISSTIMLFLLEQVDGYHENTTLIKISITTIISRPIYLFFKAIIQIMDENHKKRLLAQEQTRLEKLRIEKLGMQFKEDYSNNQTKGQEILSKRQHDKQKTL